MPSSRSYEFTEAVPMRLLAPTAAMLLASLYLTFVWVPMELSMGVVQRIFYLHVASAFVAFTGFFIGGFASIRYLATRESRFDDLSVAANEVGFLFAVVNLTTGSLWARPI